MKGEGEGEELGFSRPCTSFDPLKTLHTDLHRRTAGELT